MLLIAAVFLILILFVNPILGLIIDLPIGIIFIAVSASMSRAYREKEEERKKLISKNEKKICIHCCSPVDPRADICPYCRQDPYI